MLNTKRFCSVFTQLLQLFSREDFHRAVQQHNAERHARGFRCWDQFVAMLFCQLGQAHSLREICGGLASCEGKLAQFGSQEPKRSTLAYANEHRPWQLFQTVFYQMLQRCQQLPVKKRFRFKNRLLSLDATVIELCATAFPWSEYTRHKGAVKLHFTLDHQGYLPTWMVMGTWSQSELAAARLRQWEPGSIVVFDRGYVEFGWFWKLTQTKVFFVTRMKKFARYEVVQQRQVPSNRGVDVDQIIRYVSPSTRRKYPGLLRRVVARTPEGEVFEFLTNNFDLAATTIADIYKDRWQIESFFKLLKQNLRVKTFIGTSANALLIQIWTALIAMLVLKYLQIKARFGWSLSNLVAFLRMNLFVHRDLWAWLHDPFSPTPDSVAGQLDLGFS